MCIYTYIYIETYLSATLKLLCQYKVYPYIYKLQFYFYHVIKNRKIELPFLACMYIYFYTYFYIKICNKKYCNNTCDLLLLFTIFIIIQQRLL